jgi:phosphoglycerate dehydrogenase-like enzyme
MAETVLGMLLYFFRGLDLALAAQRASALGKPRRFMRLDAPIRELGESTVGIMGFGGVGQPMGLGSRRLVDGFSRSAEGRARGVLDDILSTSDAVVLTLPETEETRGLLGADAPGAPSTRCGLHQCGPGCRGR